MIDKNDPRLTAFLLDELDCEEAALVQAALDKSPDLREHVAGLRSTIGTLNRACGADAGSGAALTPEQLQQIQSAASATSVTASQEPGDGSVARIRWRNFAIAALLLYAVGMSVFAFRQPTSISAVSPESVSNQPQAAPAKTGQEFTIDDSASTDPVRLRTRREFEEDENSNHVVAPNPESEDATTAMPEEAVANPFSDADFADTDAGRAANRAYGVVAPEEMDESHLLSAVEQQRELAEGGLRAEVRTQLRFGNDGKNGDPFARRDVEFQRSSASPIDQLRELQELEQEREPLGAALLGPSPNADAEQDEMMAMDFDSDGAELSDGFSAELAPESRPVVISGNRRNVDRVADVVNAVEAGDASEDDSPAATDTPEQTPRRPRSNESEQAKQDSKKKRVDAPRKVKTWKPATATTNRARLSIGHHDDLALAARDTYVRIDGFRARVFFDLYYYNDRPQQLEGQFMLRLPNDASLHYFAFGPTPVPTPAESPASAPRTGKPGEPAAKPMTAAEGAVQALREKTAATGSDLAQRAGDSHFAADPNSLFGRVKAARVAPRQKAALAYDETVRRRVDPALVEWAGPGIFQTRVFPLLPNQLHRIVVGYDVTLRDDGNDRVYSLNLPAGEAGGRVEFDIAAAAGSAATIAPETDPFVSGGRAYYRFVDARPRDYTVRLTGTDSVVLDTARGSGDAYFATRLIANLPDAETKNDSSRAVFLLDTSWSDRPAAFSRRLDLLQHVLEQNRDTLQEFAVLMFNVEQRWWKKKYVANTTDNVAELLTDADQLVLEGATDLHGALAAATKRSWRDRNDEASRQPNFFLFSDAAATWGQTDLASLADPLSQVDRSTGGGALFAYHLAGHRSDKATLNWLAEASGGAVFDVAEQAELDRVAVAHRSRPWQIVKATARGADEILIGGASGTVYPNQPLLIAGRGTLQGPLRIELTRGKEKRTLEFKPRLAIASPAAARLYGQLAVERLEPYADNLEEVTIAFARYFRVPGRTCSMVMLETAADYQRFGVNVPPAEDQLVIASTSVAGVIEEQESELLDQRKSPRKRFLAWVDSLESASLLNVSTALRLAMKRLPDSAFRFHAKPLACRSWKKDQLDNDILTELNRAAPGFDTVMRAAERRLVAFGADDALKSASTLVEAKPSDADTLRSVAFRALEWQRSDQAAPLLWRLAQARPYQPQCLLLLARAAWESGDVDAAVVCYDLVSSGNWNQRWLGAKDIAQIELLNVLESVDSGQVTSALPQYARARLQQLRSRWCDEGMDLAVIMHWNTDRTDVDLHVIEPSGEECFYSHNRTKSGGRLTQDITQGLGPEMYTLETAPAGDYRVEAKYYSADQNRTKARTETLLTVIENIGRSNAKSETKRITLSGTGEKQFVLKTNVKH